MKQCTYCGAELAEEAMVCTVCGRPLEEAVQQPAEAEVLVTQEPIAEPFVCEVAPVAKKRNAWPWITAGIVLLLAAIAALYFFVLRKPEPPTPQESLTAAMQTTISDLKTVLAKRETLVSRVKALEGIRRQSAHIAMDFLVDGPEDGSDLDSVGMKLEGNLDAQGDVIAEGELSLNIDMYEKELPLSLHFSIDREEIQLSMPKYLDDVYSLPFEDLQELLALDEEDLALISEAFKPKKNTLSVEELKTQLRQLWDTATFTDITDTVTEIPVEGEAKRYACYQLVFDEALLAQLLEQLAEQMQQNYPEAEPQWPQIECAIFHVYNDKVVGMELLYSYNGESQRDGLWLRGENNPWERIEATEDGEAQDGAILIATTEQGFTLTFESEEERFELDYNDADCSFVIRTDNGYQEQEIELSLNEWNGGVELTMDVQEDDIKAVLSMSIAPMKTSPERLSEDAENLLDMSQEDLEKLLMKILMELVTDPETAWILDSMQGIAA